MELKGRATIQIFDDKNQLKHELVEENIITKAVSRIASLEGRAFLQGLRTTQVGIPYYHLPGITPISTELFGGILLFEGAIEENEERFYPPIGAKAVGHAGTPYSGANPNRGTYNSSESGLLYSGTTPIGYRHVWDFATDRCNGRIGSLCLTSKLGGNTGWKPMKLSISSHDPASFDQDTAPTAYLCAGTSLNAKTFGVSNAGKGVSIVPAIHPTLGVGGRVIYVNDETGVFYFFTTSGEVQRGTLSPSITLGLDTSVVSNRNQAPVTSLFTVSSNFGNKPFIMFDPISELFTVVVATSSTKIERRTYGMNGSVTTHEINLPQGTTLDSWTSPNTMPFYYKGLTYAIIRVDNALKMAEFDDTGALIRTFDWSTMTPASMWAFYSSALDRVVLRSAYFGSTSYGIEVLFDGNSFDAFRPGDYGVSEVAAIADCQDSKTPGFYCSTNQYVSGGFATELYYCFRTNYLASINNIANPIVKTSADTMKITYDIYTA